MKRPSRTSKKFKPKQFGDVGQAISYCSEIYNDQTGFLQDCFQDFAKGDLDLKTRVSGFYPYVRVLSDGVQREDRRRSYGFVPRAGGYTTTLTRPDVFEGYLKEQFELIVRNHQGELEIGLSTSPIPIHFALGENFHPEQDLDEEQINQVPNIFDVPDLDHIDDEIANSAFKEYSAGDERPLALFNAARIDLSLQRLRHYTGTLPKHFQHYVIFTNYQFYIDEFIKTGRAQIGIDGYNDFIEPDRASQMPAYHLTRPDGQGITMVNIGVGPSNAKTITDHIAVLRPHAWLMLGHCAGLRNSQKLGDYVLAHAYLRMDHVLDEDLPLSIPIPALSEIQQSLEKAVEKITGEDGYEMKKIMRTGTVATTDDRNWEMHKTERQKTLLSQSRAIAMDMESGTIAANGFRFRVPYGTLLCVSDRPLHGQLKLPGMADSFYRRQVEQHLKVGLETMKLLREIGPKKLHSRKLRSFDEVAFR